MPTDPLVGALRNCSLHVLLVLISKALTRAGYGDVEILDRRDAGQKSRHGGHEMACHAFLGSSKVKVLVKLVRQPVRTRMLDEMAGVVRRMGAEIGVLVTPFEVSPSIAAKQALYAPTRLETWDGSRLSTLMRCSGVGVRESGEPDYEFLSALEEFCEDLSGFVRERNP